MLRSNLTVAEWVRGALRAARQREPARGAERKLAAVRAASQHAFPTAHIAQMLAEIERGYGRAARGVIFVDSNVPMYLVGAEHPNKIAARLLLERAIANGERLVSDAEVLQEILHRYVAIARRDAIHVALMDRHAVSDILTFDSGFDQVPGIRRMSA